MFLSASCCEASSSVINKTAQTSLPKEIKDLNALLSEEIKDPSNKIAKYSNVLKCVKEMQENREAWAMPHRYDIIT